MTLFKKQSLRSAINRRDADKVRSILKKGLNINHQGKHEYTYLNYAINEGAYEICKILVDNGIDVNLRNYRNQNSLEHAIFFQSKPAEPDRSKIVNLLINNNVNMENMSIENFVKLAQLNLDVSEKVQDLIVEKLVINLSKVQNDDTLIDNICESLPKFGEKSVDKLKETYKDLLSESILDKLFKEEKSDSKIRILIRSIKVSLEQEQATHAASIYTDYKVDRSVESVLDKILAMYENTASLSWQSISSKGAQFAVNTSGQNIDLPNADENRIDQALNALDESLLALGPSAGWILIERMKSQNSSIKHRAELGLIRLHRGSSGIANLDYMMLWWVKKYGLM